MEREEGRRGEEGGEGRIHQLSEDSEGFSGKGKRGGSRLGGHRKM
jgi:hypothetical protein